MDRILRLHSGRQTFDYDCGATALQIVMASYGIDMRGDRLMRQLGTGAHGTPLSSMVDFPLKKGFKVDAGEGWTVDILKRYVDGGDPVIVLLQAWAERFMTLEEWRKDMDDGHYAIVVGYDRDVLLFEDPSSFHTTWLAEGEFEARWHDRDPRNGEVIEHFGMALLGKEPVKRTPKKMG